MGTDPIAGPFAPWVGWVLVQVSPGGEVGVGRARFRPKKFGTPTLNRTGIRGLGNRCSIHLSYGGTRGPWQLQISAGGRVRKSRHAGARLGEAAV